MKDQRGNLTGDKDDFFNDDPNEDNNDPLEDDLNDADLDDDDKENGSSGKGNDDISYEGDPNTTLKPKPVKYAPPIVPKPILDQSDKKPQNFTPQAAGDEIKKHEKTVAHEKITAKQICDEFYDFTWRVDANFNSAGSGAYYEMNHVSNIITIEKIIDDKNEVVTIKVVIDRTDNVITLLLDYNEQQEKFDNYANALKFLDKIYKIST